MSTSRPVTTGATNPHEMSPNLSSVHSLNPDLYMPINKHSVTANKQTICPLTFIALQTYANPTHPQKQTQTAHLKNPPNIIV